MGSDTWSSDREERLHAVLLGYLEADTLGEAPDPSRLLEQHPEFADELAEFFACRRRVESIVAPLRTGMITDSGAGEVGAFRGGFGGFAPARMRRQ